MPSIILGYNPAAIYTGKDSPYYMPIISDNHLDNICNFDELIEDSIKNLEPVMLNKLDELSIPLTEGKDLYLHCDSCPTHGLYTTCHNVILRLHLAQACRDAGIFIT